MATATSLNGTEHLEPHTSFPARRFFSGLTTYLDAIREGSAAAYDYDRLLKRGVPHDEAVHRVFDEHFASR